MTKMDAMPCYFAAEMIGHWPFNWHAWNGEKLPPFSSMGKRTVGISICARLTVLETEVWGENSGKEKAGHGSLGVRVCRGRLVFTLFLMLHSPPPNVFVQLFRYTAPHALGKPAFQDTCRFSPAA